MLFVIKNIFNLAVCIVFYVAMVASIVKGVKLGHEEDTRDIAVLFVVKAQALFCDIKANATTNLPNWVGVMIAAAGCLPVMAFLTVYHGIAIVASLVFHFKDNIKAIRHLIARLAGKVIRAAMDAASDKDE